MLYPKIILSVLQAVNFPQIQSRFCVASVKKIRVKSARKNESVGISTYGTTCG
jgi:hypothetical protein